MRRETIFNRKKLLIETESDADDSVFHEIFTERDYQHIESEIKNAKNVIIDIGAHIGLFALYLNALNPNVKIVSFEPEERNYNLLKRNIKENRATNITVKNLAVSSEEGQKILYISADSHNHSLKKESINIISEKKTISISAENLFGKFEKIDLVKMDCEGAEFEILASMSRESFARINCFAIEYHEYVYGDNSNDLRNILERNGFKVQKNQSKYDKRMGFIKAIRYTANQ